MARQHYINTILHCRVNSPQQLQPMRQGWSQQSCHTTGTLVYPSHNFLGDSPWDCCEKRCKQAHTAACSNSVHWDMCHDETPTSLVSQAGPFRCMY